MVLLASGADACGAFASVFAEKNQQENEKNDTGRTHGDQCVPHARHSFQSMCVEKFLAFRASASRAFGPARPPAVAVVNLISQRH
jgi:hypothetical protein